MNRKWLIKPIVLALPLAFILVLVGWSPSPQAMPLADLIQPDGVNDVVGEGDDFATTVLRDPWDMNEVSDVWEMQNAPDAVFTNGTLAFTAGDDSYFWLLHQGYISAQNIGKTGVMYPINADHYRILSFRMWSENPGFAFVHWYKDQDVAKFGVTHAIEVQPGWHNYTIDLKNIGFSTSGGGTGWYGNVLGLRLTPWKRMYDNSSKVEIDWVRLTPQDTSQTISISWRGLSGSVLEFYLDEDQSGCDGPRIGSIKSPPSSGTFDWGAAVLPDTQDEFPFPLPPAVAPGSYYVCGRMDGGSPFYSSGRLFVDRAPMLWFTYPDHLTGPDYATAAGVPWDMNDKDTFIWMNNIDTFKFSDGQFLATNSGGDAALRLNTPIPVDTRKYKYLSFRMLLEGEFDLFGGWVSRLFWYDSPRQPSISDDIVIRPGWNTYTLDLTKAVTEPGSSPWSSDSWEWIRFDPNENIRGVPWTFHIDYLVLTGDPTGKTNSNVSIWYELSEQAGVTVKLYYDKDTKPGGEVPIVEHFATSPQLAGPYFVYAPGVSGNYTPSELPEPTGIRVQWDTTGVPAGSYYILAEASDGFNVTRWYSEVPLVLSSN